MINAFIALACAAVLAVLAYPLVRDHRAAIDGNEYRNAVMTEAFSNCEKARPERRARQRRQQVEMRPRTAPEPVTRAAPFRPFPSVFSQ